MFFRLAVFLLLVNFLSCTGLHVHNIADIHARESANLTPLLARVDDIPQAFYGSDNKYHIAYELILTNYYKLTGVVKTISIKNAYDNQTIHTLSKSELASRMRPFGSQIFNNNLDAGQTGVVFVHLIFENKDTIPALLTHEIDVNFLNNNKIENTAIEQVARIEVNLGEPIIIGAPLKGARFVAADSCCDSTRHVRAGLPINGKLKYAQRFAVDYEQIDTHHKIYKDSQTQLTNFHIYGQEALAVAPGIIVKVVDGIKESSPGAFPRDTTLENADGNSVILKIAPQQYALYAHLQPHSIRVKVGDQVVTGQTLGLVGNSGNSLAPHLHFQVMDSPSALNANGLPYLIDSYVVVALGQSTEDFDRAESSGIGLSLKSSGHEKINNAYPMDLSVLSF